MISQISSYDKLYNYNVINSASVSGSNDNTDIASQAVQPLSGQEVRSNVQVQSSDNNSVSADTSSNTGSQDDSRYSNAASRKNSSIEDVLSSFGNSTIDAENGSSGAVENSDVIQAINGMKRDSVLQEYQFFVGNQSRSNILTQDEDGLVMRLS